MEEQYKKYLQLSKRITKGDERHIDLLHDILIQLYTNEKWNNLKTEQEKMYFLTRTITNQFYSNNSKFQRTYRKFNSEVIDIPEVEDVPYQDRPSIEWLNNLLDNELKTNPDNWYNVGLFRMYMEHRKIEPIHKKTKIPRYSIRITINEMKAWVKIKWIEKWER
jgi:4-hydroxy-3-methylbut-2-en-1-yl diphosphate synthase IspG/GcpE